MKKNKPLNNHKREAFSVHELSDNDIRDIAAAKVPEEYNYLNKLMTDEKLDEH